MSTSFILILLFASLHACNANWMINRKFVLPDTKPKNVEEMKSQSKVTEARLLKEGYNNTKTAPALSAEQEEFKVLPRVEGREETTLGNTVTRSLVQHHEVEGLKVQARSMLERISRKSNGPSSSEDTRDEITEDVAIMDYSHAQRKPPIHN